MRALIPRGCSIAQSAREGPRGRDFGFTRILARKDAAPPHWPVACQSDRLAAMTLAAGAHEGIDPSRVQYRSVGGSSGCYR
mgnify:CR=1 FL=1